VVTFVKVLAVSPNAVTALLSQMPIVLSKMWLRTIVRVTGVPPENERDDYDMARALSTKPPRARGAALQLR
jgi:hypothetical protein